MSARENDVWTYLAAFEARLSRLEQRVSATTTATPLLTMLLSTTNVQPNAVVTTASTTTMATTMTTTNVMTLAVPNGASVQRISLYVPLSGRTNRFYLASRKDHNVNNVDRDLLSRGYVRVASWRYVSTRNVMSAIRFELQRVGFVFRGNLLELPIANGLVTRVQLSWFIETVFARFASSFSRVDSSSCCSMAS